jgi:hypothetical protein
MGRFDEASHPLEIAQRVDPFSNRQKVARTKFLHLTRRYEEGVHQLSELSIYGPLPVEAQFFVALMSAHFGMQDQAKKLARSIRPASGAELPMMAGVAEVLALSGEMEQARQIVLDHKIFSQQTEISRFRQALLAVALGDNERSLSLLTSAVENREAELVWIGVDPRFDPIREQPMFNELVNKVSSGFTS